MFHLGIYDYLYYGFIAKLSGDTRKQFKDISKSTVVKLRTQVVDADLPKLSTFRHRIHVRRHMQSERVKPLMYCCYMNSDCISSLENTKMEQQQREKIQVARSNTKTFTNI